MKTVIDYTDILESGEVPTTVIGEMLRGYRQAAAMSLLLAQAITRKDHDLKLGAPHKPNATSDSLQLQAGKVPKRKAAMVTVDLTRVTIPEHPEEHSHLADYQKARHWVQSYQYTKRDGRLITVPEHERWKASSPFPALRKAHFVKGDPSL